MTEATNILVFGRNGQVATELRRAEWPEGYKVGSIGREYLDLATAPVETISDVLSNANTALAINAAAYTAVDQAEQEQDAASALNTFAPRRIAEACAKMAIPLIHLSTDYVFDGEKTEPYLETDETRPLGIYGATKLAGEKAVQAIIPQHIILRTAWVYSPHGKNFVKTMLRLGRERDELTVVNDQWGAPTSAAEIARALVQVSSRIVGEGAQDWGLFHFTAAGRTSWYDFAREIFRQAQAAGAKPGPRISPIPATDYPTPAARPQNSVLDCLKIEAAYGVHAEPWQQGLKVCLDELLR